MSTYTEIGTEVGQLVDRKNEAYGSSFAKAGEFLALLWPKGLQPSQYREALLLVRIFDKQMRIATDSDAFGESPYRDVAGYGLLGAVLHEERKRECGTARLDAVEQSKAQPASAAHGASLPTMPIASAPNAQSCSPSSSERPSASVLEQALADAFAQTATAHVVPAEDARESEARRVKNTQTWQRWIMRKDAGQCASCGEAAGNDSCEMGTTGVIFDVHKWCVVNFLNSVGWLHSEARR